MSKSLVNNLSTQGSKSLSGNNSGSSSIFAPTTADLIAQLLLTLQPQAVSVGSAGPGHFSTLLSDTTTTSGGQLFVVAGGINITGLAILNTGLLVDSLAIFNGGINITGLVALNNNL